MKLIIDNRETAFIEKLNILYPPLTHQIEIEIARLDLGDMIIRSEGSDEDIIIFERKTIYDLAASIKDGRYNEQSFRLSESHVHNHNIIYLVEGDIERLYEYKAKIKKSVLYSCLASLSFYKGFSVYNTKSLEESCRYIFNFTTKLRKEYFNNRIPYYRNYRVKDEDIVAKTTCKEEEEVSKILSTSSERKEDESEVFGGTSPFPSPSANAEDDQIINNSCKSAEESSVFIIPASSSSDKLKDSIDSKYIYQAPKPRYSEIIKKEKKANITLDNIGEIMLCAIPGIGSQCAYSIMNKYNGSLLDMLVNLSEDPTALDNIKIENNQGQQRKISKSSIDNIKRFMLKNNIES